MLRFITAGSVDDGKSTLIGRLLYDTQGILAGPARRRRARLAAPRRRRELDLSLLTDGLEAEREQGITIDVAYRYFATPRRKFIIADTPGPRAVHAQHGDRREQRRRRRDAGRRRRKGLLPQTRRHLQIARLLGIRTRGRVVNKMDLVGLH